MSEYNKVILGNEVLIDLTEDTAVESVVQAGYTFHKANGEKVEGTNAFTVDASGVTAIQSEVLATKTFAKGASVLTGTMPNVGTQTSVLSDIDDVIAITQGYHDGAGSVSVDATEKAKIIPGNIKAGIEMLGVTGTYSGEAINVTSATATPAVTQQTILPPSGYDYLSQVTVEAIPVVETANPAGGITVKIG